MMTKIDRKLHLVMEFSRGEEPPLIVHSTPLPMEVFEQYFDWFGPTTNRMVADGYGHFAPRYAALILRQVARKPLALVPKDSDAYKQAETAVEARLAALFGELHRLTLVLAIVEGKWDMIPIDDAKNAGILTTDEYSRIDAALIYFICASESVPPEDREATLGGLALFNSRTESLNCTDFLRSLQTSMTVDSSGAKKAASLPSSPGSPPPRASASTSSASPNPNSHPPGLSRKPTGIVFSSPQS